MTDALLLVDVQRNMLEDPAPVPGVAEVRPALEALLAGARAAGVLVVQVQNDGGPGEPDEPGSPGWELALPAQSGELVLRKTEPDTFASNPDLGPALAERGVHRLVVAGMQSEYCIAATSRGAVRHGFAVVLVSGAHATYDDSDPAPVISATIERDLLGDGVAVVPVAEIAFGS